MDILCPRCGGLAEPAGHEDARAFLQCPTCDRVWATRIRVEAPDTPTVRVLVAEDSPEMLGLMSAWLEEEGCMVIGATSGRQAIDAALVHKPDVAIVDVVLPPPDGFHVCEVLTRRLDIAAILMTGIAQADPVRIDEAGALMMLRKPFERETLMDALSLALEHCRRRRAAGGAAFAAS